MRVGGGFVLLNTCFEMGLGLLLGEGKELSLEDDQLVSPPINPSAELLSGEFILSFGKSLDGLPLPSVAEADSPHCRRELPLRLCLSLPSVVESLELLVCFPPLCWSFSPPYMAWALRVPGKGLPKCEGAEALPSGPGARLIEGFGDAGFVDPNNLFPVVQGPILVVAAPSKAGFLLVVGQPRFVMRV